MSKETILEMSPTLTNVTQILDNVTKRLIQAHGADLLICIGNTGCGKSTILASLIYGPSKMEMT